MTGTGNMCTALKNGNILKISNYFILKLYDISLIYIQSSKSLFTLVCCLNPKHDPCIEHNFLHAQ